MLLFVIVALALLLWLGASLVLLRRYAGENREQARLCQQLRLEADRLRESEQRHQMLFASNPYPMWIHDCETLRFLAVNDAAVRTYGYTQEEFLAMTLLDIRSPEEAPALRDAVSGRKNGLNNSGIWRHRCKDGSLLFAEVKAFRFEENGRKQELVLANDMTQHYMLEGALQQSRAYLQSLVDSAPLGICRSFIEGDCIETLNSTLREMLGYSLEEALQLKVTRTICPSGRGVVSLRRTGLSSAAVVAPHGVTSCSGVVHSFKSRSVSATFPTQYSRLWPFARSRGSSFTTETRRHRESQIKETVDFTDERGFSILGDKGKKAR